MPLRTRDVKVLRLSKQGRRMRKEKVEEIGDVPPWTVVSYPLDHTARVAFVWTLYADVQGRKQHT